MRVPRGPGPKSGRKRGGKAGPLTSGPKAPARATRAPKAAAARQATPTPPATKPEREIGRASCRDRVCPYGRISAVAVSLKPKTQTQIMYRGRQIQELKTHR